MPLVLKICDIARREFGSSHLGAGALRFPPGFWAVTLGAASVLLTDLAGVV